MEESLFENFVCNLCLELYTEPKSLPCLHSFCRECLLCYLQSRQPSTASSSSVVHYDSFPCPVCKQRVTLEWQKHVSFGSLDMVVDSFRDNFHLVSLMQELDIKPLTKYCGMCINDDIKARSVVWCEECNQALCQDCADTHRSLRMTASHKLCMSGSMKRMKMGSSGYPCSKHENETLKSFCMNCQMCTCYKCHMTIHKNCSNVLLLEDAVCDFTPNAKLMIEDLKRQMESMVNLQDKITRQVSLKVFKIAVVNHKLVKFKSIFRITNIYLKVTVNRYYIWWKINTDPLVPPMHKSINTLLQEYGIRQQEPPLHLCNNSVISVELLPA